MKKYLTLSILLLSCLGALAEVTLGFPGEKSAGVGIYVKDLTTGEIVAENDAAKAMMPASVMKAVTAASVWSSVDEGFRFSTKVYLTGDIADGVCSGNLIINASNDPTIDSELFEGRTAFSREILDSLKNIGVSRIEGKILVKESLLDTGCIPQWEIDDVAWGYGAGYYGFNYRDNEMLVWPVTGASKPHDPNLKITLKNSASTDLLRGIFSDNLHAFGNTGNKQWVETTTMNNPASVFAYELKSLLEKNSIAVIGNDIASTDAKTPVADHLSPSLYEILHEMLIHSHNMYAEAMLRLLTPGSTRKTALQHELSLWNGRNVSTSYMRICDGSGLSRADRLRPTFIANVLEWMAKSDKALSYSSLFPKVGKEGTVKNFLKGTRLQGKLALKTGSMSGVQCYAGYKLDDDGKPTHVVVVLINAFYCERSTLRGTIEKFLLKTL